MWAPPNIEVLTNPGDLAVFDGHFIHGGGRYPWSAHSRLFTFLNEKDPDEAAEYSHELESPNGNALLQEVSKSNVMCFQHFTSTHFTEKWRMVEIPQNNLPTTTLTCADIDNNNGWQQQQSKVAQSDLTKHVGVTTRSRG